MGLRRLDEVSTSPLEHGPTWVEMPYESFASFSDRKEESG